jgi:hypothetical protein
MTRSKPTLGCRYRAKQLARPYCQVNAHGKGKEDKCLTSNAGRGFAVSLLELSSLLLCTSFEDTELVC